MVYITPTHLFKCEKLATLKELLNHGESCVLSTIRVRCLTPTNSYEDSMQSMMKSTSALCIPPMVHGWELGTMDFNVALQIETASASVSIVYYLII